MAHFDVHKNRGYDGYGEKQPVYYGGRAAIVGYTATSENYVALTEAVVTLSGGYPMTRPDLQEQFWPRSATHHDQYDNSPKRVHAKGSPRDSPRKAFDRANSPPTGHYPNKYGEVLTHAIGSPHDGAKSPPTGHYPNKYGAHLHDYDSPRSPKYNHNNGSPRDSPRKAFHGAPNSPSTGHYPTKYGSPHDSPRKISRDNRGAFSSNDDDSSDDEEVECRDGVCYPKPKYGGGQGYDRDEKKKKGNGYPAGNYPVQQHSSDHHQPRKDPHQASDGKKIYGSHYNAPAHTKPTTDAYYDPYAVRPAPIRTKPDHHDGGRFGGENGKSSPVSAAAHWTPFAGQQGKSERIDSTEAQRRYGTAPPYSGHKYGAAIDSKTAAKIYGGVFVSD